MRTDYHFKSNEEIPFVYSTENSTLRNDNWNCNGGSEQPKYGFKIFRITNCLNRDRDVADLTRRDMEQYFFEELSNADIFENFPKVPKNLPLDKYNVYQEPRVKTWFDERYHVWSVNSLTGLGKDDSYLGIDASIRAYYSHEELQDKAAKVNGDKVRIGLSNPLLNRIESVVERMKKTTVIRDYEVYSSYLISPKLTEFIKACRKRGVQSIDLVNVALDKYLKDYVGMNLHKHREVDSIIQKLEIPLEHSKKSDATSYRTTESKRVQLFKNKEFYYSKSLIVPVQYITTACLVAYILDI